MAPKTKGNTAQDEYIYRELFDTIDDFEKEGLLDRQEIRYFLDKVIPLSRQEQVANWIAEADADNSGVIEFMEFKGLLFKIQHECNLTPHMLLQTFRDTAKQKKADIDAKMAKFGGGLPDGDGPKRLKPAEKIKELEEQIQQMEEANAEIKGDIKIKEMEVKGFQGRALEYDNLVEKIQLQKDKNLDMFERRHRCQVYCAADREEANRKIQELSKSNGLLREELAEEQKKRRQLEALGKADRSDAGKQLQVYHKKVEELQEVIADSKRTVARLKDEREDFERELRERETELDILKERSSRFQKLGSDKIKGISPRKMWGGQGFFWEDHGERV